MNCLLNIFGLPCLLDLLSKIFTLRDLQGKDKCLCIRHLILLSQSFCVPFRVLIPISNFAVLCRISPSLELSSFSWG